VKQTLTNAEILEKIGEMDAEIAKQREVVDNAKLALEYLGKKRRNWCMHNCPHTQTYQRSIMGREYDTYCSLCETCLT
jgi:hypothetical protein